MWQLKTLEQSIYIKENFCVPGQFTVCNQILLELERCSESDCFCPWQVKIWPSHTHCWQRYRQTWRGYSKECCFGYLCDLQREETSSLLAQGVHSQWKQSNWRTYYMNRMSCGKIELRWFSMVAFNVILVQFLRWCSTSSTIQLCLFILNFISKSLHIILYVTCIPYPIQERT